MSLCMMFIDYYSFLFFFFFFSSRRRHTRSKRDWSSDVCSSDLSAENDPDQPFALLHSGRSKNQVAQQLRRFRQSHERTVPLLDHLVRSRQRRRSEERRVGKECRSRWSAEH